MSYLTNGRSTLSNRVEVSRIAERLDGKLQAAQRATGRQQFRLLYLAVAPLVQHLYEELEACREADSRVRRRHLLARAFLNLAHSRLTRAVACRGRADWRGVRECQTGALRNLRSAAHFLTIA